MWVPQRGRVSGRPPAAAAGGVGRGVLTLAGEGLQRLLSRHSPPDWTETIRPRVLGEAGRG
jgi:hypothetical protein